MDADQNNNPNRNGPAAWFVAPMLAVLPAFGDGDIRARVAMPGRCDERATMEWLAVNSVHFYNATNAFWEDLSGDGGGARLRVCACAKMTAGPARVYSNEKEHTATVYIDRMLDEAHATISAWPREGEPLATSKSFKKRVSAMFVGFYAFYAHVYHHHYLEMLRRGMDCVRLNSVFRHLFVFVTTFGLINEKDELLVLRELYTRFLT